MATDGIVTINAGPGGRVAASGHTPALPMQRAYGVMDWNIAGGPGWSRTDLYDVAAKAIVAGNLTEKQLQPMLQGCRQSGSSFQGTQGKIPPVKAGRKAFM
jgi:uncharacterized protein (TIGR03435 family)